MDLPPIDPYRDHDWVTPPDATIAMAFIGLGAFTTDWVLPSAEAADHVTIGAVVSGSPEKADRHASEYDAVALDYQDYANGIASDAYDAVYIATPNATHLDHATTAAEQEKAVLCEKPIEVNATRAQDLVNACTDAGVTLQIAYRLQVDPVVRYARAVLDSGVLGTPVHAQATMSQHLFNTIAADPDQWRLDHSLSGGAALIDLGIYPLNTLRFLTEQNPTQVWATTRSPDPRFSDVDQHAAFTIAFEDGLLGACTASQLAARTDHLHLVCSDGHLVLNPAFFGEVRATITKGEDTRTVSIETNEMRAQLDYFASHVLRDVPPEPDGDHALIDAETIDAAYESAATNTMVSLSDEPS